MRKKFFNIVVLLSLLVLGCADTSTTYASNTYKDKRGLIRFRIPENWILKNEENDMRFVRADNPQEPTVLVVEVDPQAPKRSLEQQQKISRAQIRQQDAEVITDRMHSINGFSAWESEFKWRRQSVHSFYLFSDKVRVEVMLIALSDMHQNYVTDLNSVVKSIQAN